MNRAEFMRQLEQLLMDVPPSDRQDAIAYYNGYFDEAGPENEANVIQELGNPGKVAGIIKADLAQNGSGGEYTETGYKDTTTGPNLNTPTRRENGYQEPPQRGRWPIALIIVILVFASPLILGLGGGLLGLIFGILAAIAGVVIAIVAAAVSLLVSGVGTLVLGIMRVITYPLAGLVLMGTGGLCIAVGILAMILFAWLAIRWLPALFRAIVNLCQRLLHRDKRTNEGRDAS